MTKHETDVAIALAAWNASTDLSETDRRIFIFTSLRKWCRARHLSRPAPRPKVHA
jgi:hypothetical protein